MLGWIALLSELVKGRRAKKALAVAPMGILFRERFRASYANREPFELTAGEVQQLGSLLNL
jgi:hypothetical protein